MITLAFWGLVNAFGMVPPVYDLMNALASALRLPQLGLSNLAVEGVLLLLIFATGTLLLPISLALAAGWAARRLTGTVRRDSLRVAVTSFAPAFVPIGLGFWVAHYGYHFLTGIWTIIPALQNFLLEHGVTLLGEPNWALGGIEDAALIGLIQALALLAGFAGSLFVAQQVAMRLYRRASMAGLLPWALLFLLMIAAGMWLFNLPMEMRGTLTFS